jgi:phosphoribosylaminoimidazole-succinocarboxamide synthase
VRDIYPLPDGNLLIVATDRLSAYDVVLPTGIPDKGRVLNGISAFWFKWLVHNCDIRTHMLSTNMDSLPAELRGNKWLKGRFMICKKGNVVPIEAVVRGNLTGSGWKEYQEAGTVCGISLPKGLRQCERLEQPIFTPATKAETGHDENITFERACEVAAKWWEDSHIARLNNGRDILSLIRGQSIEIFSAARQYAAERGVIIADTKFEWALDQDYRLMLVDEVLTPDSSRFWPADQFQVGRDQPSFDKQFVRNWLDSIGFNRQPPGPMIPPDIVGKTREKYVQAYELLTGEGFPWNTAL